MNSVNAIKSRGLIKIPVLRCVPPRPLHEITISSRLRLNHTVNRSPHSPHKLSFPGLPPPELLETGGTRFVYADIVTDRCIPAFNAKFPDIERYKMTDHILLM